MMNAERSGTKKRKRQVEIWIEFNALKACIEQGRFVQNAISSGDRVAKMDATVEELMEQSNHFDGLLLEKFESRGKPLVTTKLFGEMFDQGLKKIWAWLNTDNISNIGIYGMGGVGKATLVKHNHNHLLEETQFMVYWITVSQEFSIKKLQDDIAKHLKLDLSCEDDEDSRAAILSRALVKQSVLILDDVWHEFPFEKFGIRRSLEFRLILTTRSLELCNRVSCQRVFEAKTLVANEATDLFNHTLDSKILRDLDCIAMSIEYSRDNVALQGINVPSGGQRPTYPSSKATKDWDKLEALVKKEEKDEKLDGDAALNKFFRDIYKDADEDTRRAMMKSFVESNGTVLSTNWKEVGAKKVEGSPPDGMEMKKWEF